jgi:DNA-binding SARP family transcriptional activator
MSSGESVAHEKEGGAVPEHAHTPRGPTETDPLNPVTIAKITAPRSSGILPRRRLFDLLDSYRAHPVTWVSAPAGSGKTSLISSYLQASGNHLLWYQVDAGDSDIATFFYYLSQAAGKTAPRKGKPLPLLTPEYLQDVPTFAGRFFDQLYNLLGAGGVMVLDDYQEAPRDSALHEVMRVALAAVPDRIRVIVISRRAPPPKFSRLRAHGNLVVLNWHDLKLESDESMEIARARLGKGCSPELVGKLHQAADGWAAGFVMLIETTRDSNPLAEMGRVSRDIFDYFASEVFERTDPEMQRLLLINALLPKMTGPMARTLTGLPDAGEMLGTLSSTGYFITEHGREEPVYEFHPLFRQFLIERASKNFPPETIAELRNRAARLLEEAGETEGAVALLLETGDWEALKPLILKHAPMLAAQGRTRTLETWLRALPSEMLGADGWLLYWLGVCLLSVDLKESRRNLEQAFARFEAGGETGGLLLAWSGIVDCIFNGWDDLSLLDPWIDWLDGRFPPPLNLPETEVEAAVTAGMLNALFARRPHHPGIREWLMEAHRVFNKSPDSPSGFRIGTSLIICYGWLGKSALADDIKSRIGRVAASPHAPPLAILTYKWAVAGSGTSLADATAISAREGLEIAHATGIHCMDFLFNGLCVSESHTAGDLESAAESLKRMANCMHGRNSRAFYHYLNSWHFYLRGSFSESLTNAEHAVRLCEESGTPLPEALCRLAYADLLIDCGMYSEATGHASAARAIAEGSNSGILLFLSCLGEARLRMANGDGARSAEALQWLRKGMAVGRANGYMNSHWWVPERMAALCLKALEAGIEREYVRAVILTRNLAPEPPPYHCEEWPWGVRIFTLGRFEIRRDDKAVQFPAKAPRRVLLLLKALVAAGAKGAAEETLAESLWPDSDGDAGLRALTTSIHRLRQLLGADGAILLRDGRLSMNPRVCWIDAHAFEALLEPAGKRPDQTDGRQRPKSVGARHAIQLIQYALSLYQGPFLEDIDEDWAVSRRERLRNAFLKTVIRLGARLEDERDFDHAAVWYERGLEVDDLAEPLYRQLIGCHLALGRKAEALTAYSRCRRTLLSVLGVDPSPETEALIKTVNPNNSSVLRHDKKSIM